MGFPERPARTESRVPAKPEGYFWLEEVHRGGKSVPTGKQPVQGIVPELFIELPGQDFPRAGSGNKKQPDVFIPVLIPGQPRGGRIVARLRADDVRAIIYKRSAPAIVGIRGPALNQTKEKGEITGTGFFVGEDGTIATDYHVIKGVRSLTADLKDGRTFSLSVKSIRPTADLALLQLQTSDPSEKFPTLPLGQSTARLESGTPVVMIGRPVGEHFSFLSEGTVDKYWIRQDLYASLGNSPDLCPVDNPLRSIFVGTLHTEGGTSGSPVFNYNGEVVGIVEGTPYDTIAESVVYPVSDLKAMLPACSSSVVAKSWRDLVIPSRLHFGKSECVPAISASLLGAGLARGWLMGKGAGPTAVRTAGNFGLLAFGGFQAVGNDLPFLKSALQAGTTAEKVAAGINVAGDLLMVGGGLASFIPPFRKAASVVQILGASMRIGNGLLAERKYI